MHDILGGLANAALTFADNSSAGSDSGVKAAVIAAAALIIATAITAFASTFQRARPAAQPAPGPVDPPLVEELRRRAVSAESRASRAEARIDQLEAFCWDNNINPHSGEMITR